MKVVYGIACTVVNKRGQILLLKRSPQKKLFPKKWFVVGAYPLKANDDMKKVAENELLDELGVKGKIIKEGALFEKMQSGTTIKVKPYLAYLNADKITLNEEHTEYQWVAKEDVRNFDLVTGTWEMIFGLLGNG